MQRKPRIDFYALCGYAPADMPQARPIAAAAHEVCRRDKDEFSDNVTRALGRDPTRCAPSLHEVGHASLRRAPTT
eukprot:485351-Pyramimonas_sp.AAC.1